MNASRFSLGCQAPFRLASGEHMTTPSEKPFPDAMRDLMEQRDMSFGRLVVATGRYRDKPFSKGMLHQVASGKIAPIVDTMVVIAKALDTDPRYFREYREYLASQEAKRMMAEVGLDRVLEALRGLGDNGRR